MTLYCIQINKLLNPKSSILKKPNLYIVLSYANQQRRTTSKPIINQNYTWFESFLFVLDSNNKTIKLEIFDNNKKKTLIASEIIEINKESKITKKNTKFLEIQHGMVKHQIEQENKDLVLQNNKLKHENNELLNSNKNLKSIINNINSLINEI